MELFNIFNSDKYRVFNKILFKVVLEGKISKSELEELEMENSNIDEIEFFFNKNLYDFDTIDDSNFNDIIKEKLIFLSVDEEDGELFIENRDIHEWKIEKEIPFMLSIFEKRYFKNILDNKSMEYVLDEKTRNLLKDYLKDVKPFNYDCIYTIDKYNDSYKKYKKQNRKNENFYKNLLTVSKAIKEKRFLQGVNYQNNGNCIVMDESNRIIPYRILHSEKKDKFQLIALGKYSTDEERLILINIENLSELKLGDKHNVSTDYLKKIINKKREERPLKLRIKKKYTSVERAFSMFSAYKKEAHYDEKNDEYILKVVIYNYDKSEIIKKLLSLGDAVEVISPISIREAIIERVSRIENI